MSPKSSSVILWKVAIAYCLYYLVSVARLL